ncbi:MAG: hypothetical protein CVV44_20785 [Spirochaetae bacterium HGW-Spirochaetae-1]|jgi:HJR/Mrr/RecB family endonuclease|nr:MAG: hypothetical protein CVV44_20785 [Spirochaetae bacterium HGW-Spirochaetae-1]
MATFKDVAVKILRKTPKPLSPKEITEIALEEGLLETEGKTPEATMAAHIYTDIKKNIDTPFIKVGRGRFSLKEMKGHIDSPDLLIEKQNEIVRKELKEKLHEMDPFVFEYLVGDLLTKIGYENVQVTKSTGDGGIDINANLTVGGVTNVKTIIQVKRFKSNIDVKIIRELRGSAEVDQRGLVITTSKFAKGAIEESQAPNKMPVSLVDGEKLIDLMFQYGVGIKKEEMVIYTLDHDYFENEVGASTESLQTDKGRSVWPLPGGINSYIATLDLYLQSIKKGINTKTAIIKWFIDTYENVTSEKTAYGYSGVPRSMGLIEVRDGVYKLTEDGERYLGSKDIEFLYDTINKNIFGFEEIVQFIQSTDEPQTDLDILDYLNENHNVGWTTGVQVTYRLMWLVNLGKIRKVDGGFVIN